MVPRYFIVCNESDLEKLVARSTDLHRAAYWAGIKVYDKKNPDHYNQWFLWLRRMIWGVK